MIYSLPYVLLVIVLGFIAIYSQSIDDEKTKRHLYVICFGILLFFFGFRGFICDDWQNYYPAFKECSLDDISFNIFDFSDSKWTFEPGFTFLMWLCKSLFANYFFFQFICCSIDLFLLFLFLRRRTDNIPFTLMLFVCLGGFIMMTNLLRNSIAILIFANSLAYIEKRKPIQYFAFCLMALSFHVSSLLFFPLYFFINLRCNKWIYLFIFFVGNIVFLGDIKIFVPISSFIIGDSSGRLQNMVNAYTSGSLDASTGISLGYIERLITGVIVFCYYDKLCEVRKENKVFINLFILYFILFFYLSEFKEMSQRLANLFFFSYWILWGDLLRCFHFENNRKLFIGFISIYCIIRMVAMTDEPKYEYDNILFGAKSYQERVYLHTKD